MLLRPDQDLWRKMQLLAFRLGIEPLTSRRLRSSVGRASHLIRDIADSIPSRKAQIPFFGTGPDLILKMYRDA